MNAFLHIDGSTALHWIARIMDSMIMYINGEGNSTTWPGQLHLIHFGIIIL